MVLGITPNTKFVYSLKQLCCYGIKPQIFLAVIFVDKFYCLKYKIFNKLSVFIQTAFDERSKQTGKSLFHLLPGKSGAYHSEQL